MLYAKLITFWEAFTVLSFLVYIIGYSMKQTVMHVREMQLYLYTWYISQ